MSAVGRLKRPIFQAASRYCRVAGLASSTNGVHAEAEADFGYRRVPKGEKKGMVGEVFSGVARKYDVMNDLMSGGLHRVWKDDFVAGLRLREAFEAGYVPPAILDLAGGTGDIAFRMLDSLSPYLLEEEKQSHGSPPSQQQQQQQQQQKQRALVTVSDINADMLQVGQSRAESRYSSTMLSGLRWKVADAEALPFDDESFDLVTIAFGLRNVTDIPKAVSEARRVLRPGGRFACLEFSSVPYPILREVYDAYSFQVIPRVGAAVAGDAEAYQYLVESIRKFPAQEELEKLMKAAGFAIVNHENYTCGVVAVHNGFKF